MKKNGLFLILHLAFTLLITLGLGCASKRSLPLISSEDFIRNLQSRFRLNAMSGDGNLIYTVYQSRKIWQYNVSMKTQKVLLESPEEIVDIALVPGQNQIFYVTASSEDGIKKFEFFSLDPASRKPHSIHTLSGSQFEFCGFDEGAPVFTYLFKNEHNSRVGIFKSSLNTTGTLTEAPELIVDPEPYLSCGYFTHKQAEYVFSRYESISTTHLLSQDLKSKTQVELVNKPGVKAMPDEHFNLETETYFVGNYSSDTNQIYTVSNKGSVSQKTFGAWDVSQFVYATSKKIALWITNEDGYSRLNIGDQNLKPLQKIDLPFTRFSIFGLSDDEKYLLLRAGTSVNDYELFRYEWQTGALIQITAFNSSIVTADQLVLAKTVHIKSTDGLQFSAVTYSPPADIKNNIALIDVHGGPQSQARPNYEMDVQFLVNKGFTVIQPNYRGSRGYGTKFERSIYKDWGGAHMLDIAATRQFLISEMGIRPDQIAIIGSSFGGYTAGVAAVQTGKDYCAAIAGFGLYNLLNDIEQVPGWDKKSISEAIGSAVKDREQLKDRSPFFAAEKIQVPMLIFYGEMDKNVLKNQSEEFIKKLKSLNKTYSEIVFENEGHGFDSWFNFRLHLKDIANFASQHCSKR